MCKEEHQKTLEYLDWSFSEFKEWKFCSEYCELKGLNPMWKFNWDKAREEFLRQGGDLYA